MALSRVNTEEPVRFNPYDTAKVLSDLRLATTLWDPMFLITKCPGVKIKHGYKLDYVRGHYDWPPLGIVMALPIDKEISNLDDPRYLSISPEGETGFHEAAFSIYPDYIIIEIEKVIEPNGSSWSFLCASFLIRELKTFFRSFLYKGDKLVYADNPDKPQGELPDQENLKMYEQWKYRPVDWRPSVLMDRKHARVIFYSFAKRPIGRIYKQEDVYDMGSKMLISSKTIQIAEDGSNDTYFFRVGCRDASNNIRPRYPDIPGYMEGYNEVRGDNRIII